MSQATATATGGEGGILSSVEANIASALSNVQGLNGELSAALSGVASVLAADNGVSGNALPTGGTPAVAGPGGASAGIVPSASPGGINSLSSNGIASAAYAVPTISGAASAAAGLGGAAAGNISPTSPGAANTLASNVATSIGNAIAGSGNSETGNMPSYPETAVSGVPTAPTGLNSVPTVQMTTVPMAEMITVPVAEIETVPVVEMTTVLVHTGSPSNNAAGLYARLNGGESTKGRRRNVKRRDDIPTEVAYFCEKNPIEEACLLYGGGGGLKMERDD